MPRRNHRVRSRRERRKSARARAVTAEALKVKTLKQTRKATRREEQKLAWAKLPDWISRRNGT